MVDEVVLYEVRDGVALLTLNRPERLNAWTIPMEDQYFDRLLQAEADRDVRAVVVTGAGRGFSPGADLGGADEPAGTESFDFGSLKRRPTTLPLTIKKPVIAAINGAVA